MDIPSLTQQLSSLASTAPLEIPDDQRRALLASCTQLRDALLSPPEKIMEIMFTPHDAVALRIAVDMKLMDVAVSNGGAITATALAEKTNSDVDLVRRISRFLLAYNLFTSPEPDTYNPTPLGLAILSPESPFRQIVIHISDSYPTTAKLPAYFAANGSGFHNPNDAYNGPWQFAHVKGEHFIDTIFKDERSMKALNVVMGMQKRAMVEQWFDFFPVEEKLKLEGETGKEGTVLIDVGGGLGHDLKRFHERFPSLPGNLVLQDLPVVINEIESFPEGMTRVGHDFFTPLPSAMHGAKAYYLRSVLHDWPDKQAAVILKNIRDVMSDDSLLLVNELIIPGRGGMLWDARQDFHMLACCSSLERNEEQWKKLLTETGFEVNAIWKGAESSLIEAKKKA